MILQKMNGEKKYKMDSKPINIDFVTFHDTGFDISNHYNALKVNMNRVNHNFLIGNSELNKKGNILNDKTKLKVLIWNARSLYSYAKKLFLIDILRNKQPDIVIVSETFLLDEDNIYTKGYKTYKT